MITMNGRLRVYSVNAIVSKNFSGTLNLYPSSWRALVPLVPSIGCCVVMYVYISL